MSLPVMRGEPGQGPGGVDRADLARGVTNKAMSKLNANQSLREKESR